MPYEMKPLACDPGRIKGMSERLIVSHYENNYGGAVKRLNLIEEQLTVADFAVASLLPGAKAAQLPLDEFPEISRWYAQVEQLPAGREPFPTTTASTA
jgi:glutathione S-transferase